MSMKHVILTSTAVLAIGLSGIPLAQTASDQAATRSGSPGAGGCGHRHRQALQGHEGGRGHRRRRKVPSQSHPSQHACPRQGRGGSCGGCRDGGTRWRALKRIRPVVPAYKGFGAGFGTGGSPGLRCRSTPLGSPIEDVKSAGPMAAYSSMKRSSGSTARRCRRSPPRSIPETPHLSGSRWSDAPLSKSHTLLFLNRFAV